MAKPINVTIKGDYNDRDINRAIRDLNSLKTQAGVSSGAMAGFGKSMAALGGMVAASLSVAAITDFFASAVAGALADEAAMKSLAVSLDNVNQGYRATDVEQFIDGLARASGTADDVLRPALQQIVTVTGDVTKSQAALKLAMDVAAGSSKSVAEVSAALSAAYAGNFTAITRLKTGIDANIIATKDMGKITAALSDRYEGQASAAADTYQGRISRLSVAVNEAKETIGYSLLGAVDDVSQAMGGTGGAAQMAREMGNGIAGLIKNIGDATALIVGLGQATDKTAEIQDEYSTKTLRGLVQVIPVVGSWLVWLIDKNEEGARAEGEHAKSLQVITDRYAGLADTAAAAAAAMEAANRQKSITAVGDRYTALARSMGEGISFKGGNLSAYFDEVTTAAGATGGAMAAAADLTKVKWMDVGTELTKSLDGAVVSVRGKGVELGGALADGYKERLSAFRDVVTKQVDIIKQGRDALDSYSQSVTDTIMGRLDFATTNADGTPMTPEQIMQTVFGDIANQQAAVTSMAGIITQLPEQFATKLLALPTTFQTQLANFLAAHPEMIAQLNTDYQALATLTETTLGIPMAAAFATVGGESAVSMIAKAKETIADEAASFRKWVRSHLATTITVKVEYDTSGAPSGLPGRAAGGPVVGGSPYIVGENGPELFVPGRSGTIVPNDVLAGSAGRVSSGGNTYAISVQAGVGDPRQIGQQVVQYIKKFEQASGPVFASA